MYFWSVPCKRTSLYKSEVCSTQLSSLCLIVRSDTFRNNFLLQQVHVYAICYVCHIIYAIMISYICHNIMPESCIKCSLGVIIRYFANLLACNLHVGVACKMHVNQKMPLLSEVGKQFQTICYILYMNILCVLCIPKPSLPSYDSYPKLQILNLAIAKNIRKSR